MKTPEELKALKAELEELNRKLSELTEEELNEVTGGSDDGSDKQRKGSGYRERVV